MQEIKKIEYLSKDYYKILHLRNLVLRKPLGLNIFDEDLSGEKDEIIYGLFFQGKIIGSVQFVLYSKETVKLRQMSIHPDYQKKSFGKSLINFVENELRKLGIKEIILHARKSALHFYLKLGYQITSNEFIEVGIPHYKMQKRL